MITFLVILTQVWVPVECGSRGLFMWSTNSFQSVDKFVSHHSTEARATVRLCRIKEKCLDTDLKCVNG